MKYFVGRQMYWPDGTLVVEIATGGLDYANPDMLGVKYRQQGEGKEFNDPCEAVESAIDIVKVWRKDEPKKHISIAHGCTGGFTLPFEPGTFEESRAWADKTFEALPKCDQCGEILPDNYFFHVDFGEDFGKFCREYCLEKCLEESQE